MSETITAAHLRAAADLITPPGKWTKGKYAVDEEGTAVDPCDVWACKWCAVGAVAEVTRSGIYQVLEMLHRLDRDRPILADINDLRGKRAAIAELRRLADLAEAREAVAR